MTDIPIITTPDPHSLPDTMSGLLEAAIADARKLDPDIYYPYFEIWHTTDNGTCTICLGGSLIAGTLQTPPDKTMVPDSFPGDVHAKLDALDSMRLGAWQSAFHRFYGQEPSPSISDRLAYLRRPSCSYFDGWEEFHTFLDSLEKSIEPLRAIELDAKAV
ncbi:MAG: hypothetical protein OXB98_13925 [Bryobacterales bacterium]|nr:hypothetical protein [Bryobacterales bacterium]